MSPFLVVRLCAPCPGAANVRYLGQKSPQISVEDGKKEAIVASKGEWPDKPTVRTRIDGRPGLDDKPAESVIRTYGGEGGGEGDSSQYPALMPRCCGVTMHLGHSFISGLSRNLSLSHRLAPPDRLVYDKLLLPSSLRGGGREPQGSECT